MVARLTGINQKQLIIQLKLKLCVNTFALKKCMYVSRTTIDLGPNSMPFLKL